LPVSQIPTGLERLGWDETYEQEFAGLREHALVPGRVVAEHRAAYAVACAEGDVWAELAGKLRYETFDRGELPAVGDWVALEERSEKKATIRAVLPRRTKISRTVASDQHRQTGEQVLAANVDTVFLVSSLNRDLNVRRLERYLATAWESGAQPVIVLNKADLCPIEERPLLVADVEAVAFGVPVHAVSAVTEEGLAELAGHLRAGTTAVLLGSSGVGKSTLINRLIGGGSIATQEIRSDGRGRHTTTHRELIPLPDGGLVIDTPGLRELQLWESGDGMTEAFADVEELATECRFSDCAHETEPGCAVRAAIRSGALQRERLDSYRKLQRELARLERRRDVRLGALERKKWRAFSKEQRRHPKTRRR
jgi:ribosome biogenesis GTPase / thiamine phosphate phosphatase